MLRLLAMVCAGSLLALAGCSGGSEDASTSPLPTPGFFGIEAVDSAIANIRSDDPAALLDSLVPVVIDCAEHTRGFLEGPTCEDADGGILEGLFPVTNCFLRYGTVEEAQQSVRGWLEAGSGPEVYGVYPAGGNDHAIVLRTILADRVAGWVLVVNEEGTVGFSSGCLQAPDAVVGAWRFGAQTFSQSQRTPTPSPTPLPTPPHTGIASIDAAIDAIQRQDAEALVALMRMTGVPCVEERFSLAPDPLCRGEPEGALVESFPISSCEGSFVPRVTAQPLVEAFAAPGMQVFAVYRFPGTRLDGGFWGETEAEYILITQQRMDDQWLFGSGLLLRGDGIVGQIGGCTQSPTQAIESWELIDPIIPPPPTATLPAPLPTANPRTSIDAIDRVIAAIEEKDADALTALARSIEVPCRKEPPYAPYPPCRSLGTTLPDGTMIEAFPASFCSQHYLSGVGGGFHTTFYEGNSFKIFAVYRTTGSLLLDGFFSIVEPEYVVLLQPEWTQLNFITVLLLQGEAIVGYGSTCKLPLEDYILGQNLTDPIIPPPQDR